MRRQQAVAAWVLALPFVVLFCVFTAGPVLASLGMSFTDLRSTDVRDPAAAVELVGLANYADLVQDPLFRKVTVNTLVYLLLGVPLTMGVALAIAVALNRLVRFRGVFRVGYYLPGDEHRGGAYPRGQPEHDEGASSHRLRFNRRAARRAQRSGSRVGPMVC